MVWIIIIYLNHYYILGTILKSLGKYQSDMIKTQINDFERKLDKTCFWLLRNTNRHLESLKTKTNITSCWTLQRMHGWTIWNDHILNLKPHRIILFSHAKKRSKFRLKVGPWADNKLHLGLHQFMLST